MSLLPELTQLQEDTSLFNRLIRSSLEATHYAVSIRKEGYRQLWSLPPERVLELLNSDVTRSLAVLQANTAQGLADNTSLDLSPLEGLPNRAPTSMPTGYTFAGGQFIYTPTVPN